MITIITGTPGAGKTLYAISKLLLPLIGTTVKQEVDGEVIEHPRKIYTNIKGLTIDHELIDGGANGGLRNWQEWAKPGAVIVFDEIQKIWTPRANGSAVPEDIKALETHRHMGVDFVFITQGLMLTERNLAMLCNRHLHVRRVANMPFAIVYEWDHASRTLLYSKSITKQMWRYDKKVFKLYHSSDLHTKQPRKMPGLIWFILIGVIALAYLAPSVYGRFQQRFAAKPAEVSTDAKKTPTEPGSGSGAPAKKSEEPAAPAPAAAEVKFVGCAASATRCTCYDSEMHQVEKDDTFCKMQSLADRPAAKSLEWLRVPDQERHQLALAAVDRADTELIAAAAARDTSQRAARAPAKAPAPLQSKTP